MALDQAVTSPASTRCLWDEGGGSLAALPGLSLAMKPRVRGKGDILENSWKGYTFSLLLLIVLMKVKPL